MHTILVRDELEVMQESITLGAVVVDVDEVVVLVVEVVEVIVVDSTFTEAVEDVIVSGVCAESATCNSNP